jgi:leucine-rich repeat protein SHOC2
MKQSEIEKTIEKAKLSRFLTLSQVGMASLPESIGDLNNLTHLTLTNNSLTSLPESIGNLTSLTLLNLANNSLTSLPESIGNLTNLKYLNLSGNELTNLPSSIGNLTDLTELHLNFNRLKSLPESIGNVFNLKYLYLEINRLTSLPESIGNMYNLKYLNLSGNSLSNLPESTNKFAALEDINLCGNQLLDLSILHDLPKLKTVDFMNVSLPHRYLTKFTDWKAEWLLYEDNTEVRRILIEQVGYEKICQELDALDIDTWREYTLLKIDEIEAVYDEYEEPYYEPMVLLKMTCPSTQHIHILRVPPEMVSAEAAITWVNHGIHPDEFAVQT